MNVARPGRRLESIDEGLPVPVFSWTATVRRVVFEPLMSGDRPLTMKDIAQRLLDMAPPEAKDDKPGAAGAKRLGALRSGRSETSVQRMSKGTLVPTRDVLFDLLRILEDERSAPQRQDLEELWAAYKPALRKRLPDVYEVYEIADGYASARVLVALQQQQIARLETGLEQHKRRAARADERVKHARRAQAFHRRALGAVRQDSDRLRVREQRMRQGLDDASAEVASLRQDVATARAQVEHWQEQADWHLREKEELRQESDTEREAWLEREALLLERLAQACETLQTAAINAAAVEAALRARETHWRDQAQAGHAAARSARADADAARSQAAVARAEAEAAREEAARVLQAQQERADALVAAAGAEQEQAQQTVGRLEEELRQAQVQLRAVQHNAVQRDAQLTSFVAERALNADLDEIVSQVLAQHEELGPGEPGWFDAAPEAIGIPSSQDQPPSLAWGGYAAAAAIPAQPKDDDGLSDGPAQPPESGPGAPYGQDDVQSSLPSPDQAVRLPAVADISPPSPAADVDASQDAAPTAAQEETTITASPGTSPVLPASGTAEARITPDLPPPRYTSSQPSGWTGERKLLFGGLAVFAAVVALFVVLVTLFPAPPGPVAYVSGSKPTTSQSGVGAFGEMSTTYTWTVDSTRPVQAHFTLTKQASTLPGELNVQPAKGCRPNVRWSLTTEGKTVADGTLTDTDNHKINGAVPDTAKTIDITARYTPASPCTTTLSWTIGT
ncbi:coiled-coil domain-containing protein [Streptomyces mirabilis]|uniref:hypothetical protein n=1 Tax=Streptomyces mirabilis TaxID=68239 RepID=UPI0036969B59